jgi:[ribosomal protein S5]-alanine N-acetyltransferase
VPRLRTSRLLLVPASIESLRAELRSNDDLGNVIGAEIPPSWPPELYDADAINWTINAIESGRSAGDWSVYYFTRVNDRSKPTLIGAGGYKGGPDDTGTVEIGYGVLPEFQRQGFAHEAVQAMLEFAFADLRVRRVIAHTLEHLVPSRGVLEKSGFDFVGAGNDPSEPDAIQYEMTRLAYDDRRNQQSG